MSEQYPVRAMHWVELPRREHGGAARVFVNLAHAFQAIDYPDHASLTAGAPGELVLELPVPQAEDDIYRLYFYLGDRLEILAALDRLATVNAAAIFGDRSV